MKFFLLVIMITLTLVAETFTIKPGWNLLGTISKIPTSQILANKNIKNVVVYSDGQYKATNKNEIDIVPEKSGFFVFSENNTTLTLQTVDTSIEVVKVDGDGNELPADAVSWKILYIKDANLYVEMKNDFTVGQSYVNHSSSYEASSYCRRLIIGNISDWRLPSISELTGISSIYQKYKDYFTVIDNNFYWSSSNSIINNRTIYASSNIITGSIINERDNPKKVICIKRDIETQ